MTNALLTLVTLFVALVSSESLNSKRKYRILNGRNVHTGEYPFVVSLMRGNRHHCGGSLLSSTQVLTAAHCCGNLTRVFVGHSNLDWVGKKLNSLFRVKKEIAHPKFSATTALNDICVVKIADKVKFTKTVQPVELPKPGEKIPSKKAFVSIGWGWTSISLRKPSNRLQSARMFYVPKKKCKKYHSKSGKKVSSMKNICIRNSGPAKGLCKGDSGGPTVSVKNKKKIIGISSWVFDTHCNPDMPQVLTRVSNYTDWILNVMQSDKTEVDDELNLDRKPGHSPIKPIKEGEKRCFDKHVWKILSKRLKSCTEKLGQNEEPNENAIESFSVRLGGSDEDYTSRETNSDESANESYSDEYQESPSYQSRQSSDQSRERFSDESSQSSSSESRERVYFDNSNDDSDSTSESIESY